ncbi:MAG: NIPSNAP family protein [Acidobacteria bacterium]|nr:MAG: NIPSNAP family protein [Acidobacteriota bacterium]
MIRSLLVLAAGLGAAAIVAAQAATPPPGGSLAPDSGAFELRTYTAAPGKLEALHARFRNHTNRLFAKHGMKIVGFWVPIDKDKGADNTLVYLLRYPDRAAREKAWEDFRKDPEWIAARDASEASGKLVDKVDSVMLTATDYSPLK